MHVAGKHWLVVDQFFLKLLLFQKNVNRNMVHSTALSYTLKMEKDKKEKARKRQHLSDERTRWCVVGIGFSNGKMVFPWQGTWLYGFARPLGPWFGQGKGTSQNFGGN